MSQQAQWDIASGVGMTALGVAALRATETHRPDGLISDPYAEMFVQRAELPVSLPTNSGIDEDFKTAMGWWGNYIGVRSRFFDDFFTSSTGAQVVILAAGLDTRAFRLEWSPATMLYELDMPGVLEFKDRVLAEQGVQPRCRRHAVGVDLREDWALELRKAGFNPSLPTMWLAEGLLPYIP